MVNRARDFTAQDIYYNWASDYAGDKSRFTAAMRRESLESLCDYFIANRFDIDDVRMFKAKALDFLVSENGKKRRGKHKSGKWVEDSDIDFDRIVADKFVKLKINDPVYSREYLPYRQRIADWVQKKFDTNSPDLIKEAHKINGQLYISFIKETFYISEK